MAHTYPNKCSKYLRAADALNILSLGAFLGKSSRPSVGSLCKMNGSAECVFCQSGKVFNLDIKASKNNDIRENLDVGVEYKRINQESFQVA
jgi:hypothetical protein